jgi:hypothetical protein
MEPRAFRVRLERPWHDKVAEFGDILLSTRLPLEDADALLCDFDPTPNLYRATVPSAWYCCEPVSTPRGHRTTPRALIAQVRLPASRILHHAHTDARYRVPAVASRDELFFADAPKRKARAVAIVSFAGTPGLRWDALRKRNAMILHERVDLFGSERVWSAFKHTIWSRPRTPENYRNAVPGSWGTRQKIALLALYHATVCMENTSEPYYFTEKFVDAVMAGCVPIYHAHQTVRDTLLAGAKWVDPAEFDFDPSRTLEYALSQDREAWAAVNRRWLENENVRSTTWSAIMERACRILRAQAG